MSPKGVQAVSKHTQDQLFSLSSPESGPPLPQLSGDINPGWRGAVKCEIVTGCPLVQRATE